MTISRTNYLFSHHHPAQYVQINARGEQDRAGYNENNQLISHIVVENNDSKIKHYDCYFFYPDSTKRFNGRNWD